MIAALFEAAIALVIALVEGIGSLFAAILEFGLLETLALPFVLLIEIIVWFWMFLVELVVSLVNWRKPKKVERPVYWRPKRRKKNPANQAE